jgi:hypothetical protein
MIPKPSGTQAQPEVEGNESFGMNSLQGQPIAAAIARLGIPNDERVIAGQKVYTWYSSTFDEGTQLQCKIRVMMVGDVIGTYEFEGNNVMCARYAAKLRS